MKNIANDDSIKYFKYIALLVLASVLTPGWAADIQYPPTAKVEQSDTYHGVKVADPYRWLEDDVRESKAVSDWVAAQNSVTFKYLEQIPQRDAIKQRISTLWDYEKYGVPFKEGGRYFMFKNDGLQNHAVLYTQPTLDAPAEVLLDPNSWSDDGTVALAGVSVSPDGHYLAYGIQEGGSDWSTWKVLDIKTRKLLSDELQWLKFTNTAWNKDGKGFYYSRYPAPTAKQKFQSLNLNHQVFYHKVGTDQAEDSLVYNAPDHPKWSLGAEVTEDGKYLLIYASEGTDARYRIVYKDLSKQDARAVTLIDEFKHDYQLAGSDGKVLYFVTTNGAPKGRLVAINLDKPAADQWRELVPEGKHVLQGAALVGGKFVANYLRDAHSDIKILNADGSLLRTAKLPGLGAVSGFGGKADDPETFYAYSSFNAPGVIYRYDVVTGKSNVLYAAKVDFTPEDYVVKQIFCASKDGTKVPMFIAHHKNIELNGNNPTLLYGYGGFNISLLPSFSVANLAWMEMGGVYAVANLRGGGEYGEQWHKAGTKLNKQNVFDDFIASGECLIDKKYTRPEKLAISGRSNGGLLVGAVTNQRPDLFAAALPAVGVMDMLRFHQFTAGRFWVDDYGSADDKEEFNALRAYSPYHNIKKGMKYPAVLVTTADTDDRVVPGHSFKYAAALQAAQAGKAPVLIRIETRAGHGSGKPTAMVIEEYVDQWAFLLRNLNMELPVKFVAKP